MTSPIITSETETVNKIVRNKRKKICVLSVGLIIIAAILLITLCLYFFLGNTIEATPSGLKIVIDHDGGADDAMAIFIALLYEKYFNGPKVVALTTNHGNVDENQVFLNSQRILDIANRRDVPIYRGSSSSIVYTYPTDYYFGQDGLGDMDNVTFETIEAEPQVAAMALIELSNKYEGELIVVALAPLTNIALASKLDPLFISRLYQLYVGAGHVHGSNPDTQTPEFNAQIDVEAYHIVVEDATPNKVTITPFSTILSSLKNVTTEWRVNVLGAIPTAIMQAQNNFERIVNEQNEIWNFLDPAVMVLVLNKSIVEDTRYSKNSISLCGDQRGINNNNFTQANEANVKIIYSMNEDIYKNQLIEIFSAE